MITTCLLLLLLQMSMECEVPSFKNVTIMVNRVYNIEIINGCISNDTIRLNGASYILVANQDVKDLNYGAVQGIASEFFIEFFNCGIEIIREGAFLDLPQLHYVTLRRNKIFWINENAFHNLPSLTRVDLDGNSFTDLSPRAFNNLPKLTRVTLSNNKLENFDQSWFYRTPALELLYLSENRLRRIPRGAFVNLPALRQLWLDRNAIESVAKDAFIGLRNLISLDLVKNKLKSFDCNFYAPSKLKYVDIRNNNITYISEEVLEVTGSTLVHLLICDNPLQCACLDKIIQWSNTFNVSVLQRQFPQSGSVCVIPKTNPSQCLERSDDDFQEGFWTSFARKGVSPCGLEISSIVIF